MLSTLPVRCLMSREVLSNSVFSQHSDRRDLITGRRSFSGQIIRLFRIEALWRRSVFEEEHYDTN